MKSYNEDSDVVEMAEAVVRNIYNRDYGTAEYIANVLRNKLRRARQ